MMLNKSKKDWIDGEIEYALVLESKQLDLGSVFQLSLANVI